MKYTGQSSVTKLVQLVKSEFDSLAITRGEVSATQVTATINIPLTIENSSNLLVYYNGILLTAGEHYTINDSNQLLLKDYTTEIGDVLSFIYYNI